MTWIFGLVSVYLLYCLYLGVNGYDRENSYSPHPFVTFVLLVFVAVAFVCACFGSATFLNDDELKIMTTYRLEQQQKRIAEDLQKLKGQDVGGSKTETQR